MPLYEMICITAHFREYKHIKELVRQASMHVLDNQGVVRNIDFWGTKSLPQKMRAHQQWHQTGDYWALHFDASPRLLHSLKNIMKRDPRVIRHTMVKLGDRVEDVQGPREKTIRPRMPTLAPLGGFARQAGQDFGL